MAVRAHSVAFLLLLLLGAICSSSLASEESKSEAVGSEAQHEGKVVLTAMWGGEEVEIRSIPATSTTECADNPPGWVDSEGNSCADYASNGWCGEWWQIYEAVDGITADMACCACGARPPPEMCMDDIAWASSCGVWRSSGWCANDTYGPSWDFAANGSFEEHVVDGVPVSEGCCGCGRLSLPDYKTAVNATNNTLHHVLDYLGVHRQHEEKVTALLFDAMDLEGDVDEIVDLPNLVTLNLSQNERLASTLPDTDGQALSKMQILDLSNTGLTGLDMMTGLGSLTHFFFRDSRLASVLPHAVGDWSSIKHIDIGRGTKDDERAFGGELPHAIGSWSSLEHWNMENSAFAGQLQDFDFGVMSALKHWNMAGNGFQSQLPDSIGGMSVLEHWSIDNNTFWGSLPDSIGSMSALKVWSGTGSLISLEGQLPESIGGMSALEEFLMPSSDFTGQLPDSIGGMRALKHFVVGQSSVFTGSIPDGIASWSDLRSYSGTDGTTLFQDNEMDFAGTLPAGLGSLSLLEILDLANSQKKLTGSFPSAITGCRSLRVLRVDAPLTGSLPDLLGDLSHLEVLDLAQTQIGGTIPSSVERLTELRQWVQADGQLAGTLPAGIGAMTRLEDLTLENQVRLGGALPDTDVGWPWLYQLKLFGMGLAGTLPDSLRFSEGLSELNCGNTRLEGTFPHALAELRQLVRLSLSNTRVGGTLPGDDSAWSGMPLQELNLGNTLLSGTIPASLARLTQLSLLRLQGARLAGSFPEEVAKALGGSLGQLYLQDNNLTGAFPWLWCADGDRCFLAPANALDFTCYCYEGDASWELPAQTWSTMEILDLSRNNIQGPVLVYAHFAVISALEDFCPQDTPSWTYPFLDALQELRLGGNQLTGPLPRLQCSFNLRVFDVSANQLQEDIFNPFQLYFTFAQNLREIHLQSNSGLGGSLVVTGFSNLEVLDASGCGFNTVPTVVASIRRLDIRSNALTQVPGGISSALSLEYLDLSDNHIATIDDASEPPPRLAEARFDNCSLHFINRQWLNENRQTALQRLSLNNNPALRIPVKPPAVCQAGTVSADPNSYRTIVVSDSPDDASYECTVPCPPGGSLELLTEPGVLDPGALCRCKEGFGLLPDDECWDQHFRIWGNSSNDLEPCSNLSSACREQDDILSTSCCGCGGSGAGGNGVECFECPQNTYSFSEPDDEFRWRSVCQHCPAGATTSGPRQNSVCDCSCPKGTYLPTGYQCQVDDWPTVQLNNNNAGNDPGECVPCSFLRTTTSAGAFGPLRCTCRVDGVEGVDAEEVVPELVDNFGQCGCPEEYYFSSVEVACRKCAIQGEVCEWGFDSSRSLRPPELQPGFWAETRGLIDAKLIDLEGGDGLSNGSLAFNGHRIYTCFSDDTCRGSNGTCAPGRGGVACSLCKPNYYGGPDGPCQECQGSVLAALGLAFIAVPFIVLLAHILSSSSDSSKRGLLLTLKAFRVSGRQFVKHMQIVGVVSGFSIGWPLDIKVTFEASAPFRFQVADFAAIACLAEQQSAALELTFRWCLPIAFAIVGTLVTPPLAACLSRLLLIIPSRKMRAFSKQLRMSMRAAMKAVYWCLLLVFPTLLSYGFSFLACRHNPNNEYTVQTFPHLHCPGSRSGTDEEWLMLLPGAIAYLLLCFIVVLGYYTYVWRQTVHHMERTAYEERGPHQFLFEDFRDPALHWPLLLLARDVLINFVQSLLINVGTAQLMCTALFSISLGYLCMKQQPYTDMSNNFLEVCNALSIFSVCVFTAGFGFAQEPNVESVAAMVRGTDGEATMKMRAAVLLGLQLISMLGPFLILGYQLLILVPFVERRLPPSWRALRQDEEDHVREVMLRNLVGQDAAHVASATLLRDFLQRLDSHELRFLANFCHSLPAAVGILRDPGVNAGVTHIVKRQRSGSAADSSPREVASPSPRHNRSSFITKGLRSNDTSPGPASPQQRGFPSPEKPVSLEDVDAIFDAACRHVAEADSAEGLRRRLEQRLQQSLALAHAREDSEPPDCSV